MSTCSWNAHYNAFEKVRQPIHISISQ